MADTATLRVRADTAQAERALGKLQTALGALVTVGAARALADIADQATLLRNRLNQVSASQAQTNLLFSKLVQVANTARTPLSQTGDLFFRIARSADSLGISQNEALLATELVSKAISSAGISAAEAAGPLLQLGQALQSGKLQGDELRSILEGLPPVSRALARSLGVPIGALKELGAQGKISSKQVIDAILEAKDVIEQDFGKTTITIGQSVTVLGNSFTRFIDNLNNTTAATSSIGRAIIYLTTFINFLGDNIDLVIAAFQLLLAIPIFRFLTTLSRGLFAAGANARATFEAIQKGGKTAFELFGFWAGRFISFFKKMWVADVGGGVNNVYNKFNALRYLFAKVTGSFIRNFKGPITAGLLFITGLLDPVINKIKEFFGIESGFERNEAKLNSLKARTELAAKRALAKKDEAAAQAQFNAELDKYITKLKASVADEELVARLRGIKAQVSEKEFIYASEYLKLIEQARQNNTLNQEVADLSSKIALMRAETQILEQNNQLREEELRAITEAGQSLLRQLNESIDPRIRVEQEYINQKIALENYYLANSQLSEEQYLEALGRIRDQYMRDQISAELQMRRSQISKEIEYLENKQQLEIQIDNEKMLRQQALYDAAVRYEEQIMAIRQKAIEMEMRARGFGLKDAKDIARERVDFEKKTEYEKAQFAIQQTASVFDNLGQRNKAAFEAAKAFNIANAIMNTYAGATKALAMYPPPFNFIAAAAVVASGLAQVAAIRSQTYSGRALGGPMVGGQQYIVGERGPELITAPSGGGRVTPNDEMGGVTNITFQIQTNDARGFDQLLVERKGMIINMIRQAQTDKGRRATV